jgi:hypothetical protein
MRYRPYLRKTPGGYEIYYTVPFERRETGYIGPVKRALNWGTNHVEMLNEARQVYERKPSIEHARWNSYGGWTSKDIDVMSEALRELSAAAGGRPVRVFLIPSRQDLDDARAGKRFVLRETLAAGVQRARNVTVDDLLPDFLHAAEDRRAPLSAFFSACDIHWSPLGHAVAAAAVLRHLGAKEP